MSWISDVREELRRLKQTDSELRKFGYTVGSVFLLLFAAGTFFRWSAVATYTFAVLGAVLLVCGYASPRTLHIFQRIWMGIAFALGWIVSRLILVLLFYGVITPIGFASKIFGKKFLDVDFHSHSSSYWIKKDASRQVKYEKMF